MPADRTALALTDAYRNRLLQTRLQAARVAVQTWPLVDLTDLDGTYARWLQANQTAVEATKRNGVTLTDAYFASYLAAELGSTVSPRGLDPEPYLGATGGRALARALSTPLLLVKHLLRSGRMPDEALRIGQARATRIVAVEALAAPKAALGDLIREEDRVKGWRRVTAPNACGACLALATHDVSPKDAHLMDHAHCRCTAEAVVKGVRERYMRPTGRDLFDSLSRDAQAALFHGRGGEEKADLIRTGAVPFDALVNRQPQEVVPDTFTEQSLGALRELSHNGGPGSMPPASNP
jgi:hypothetical protein